MILFAAAFLLFLGGCKDDDPVEYPITGTWQPTQMVKNTVANNDTTTTTETFIYTDCEKEGRWTFNEDKSGKAVQKEMFGGTTCVQTKNATFNYTYDKLSGKIIIDYINFSEQGAITDITEKTMNLKIEEFNASGYISRTYTLQKIQ